MREKREYEECLYATQLQLFKKRVDELVRRRYGEGYELRNSLGKFRCYLNVYV